MTTTVNDRELRGSDFRVAISKQSVKGAIDANPVFTPVRRTEGKNQKIVSYTEDPSVNGNMQAKEQIKESESLTAELQAVVTKQKVDWLIQAIHADVIDYTIEDDDIAFTATGLTRATGFANYFVGMGFWVAGSAEGNDGFYVVKEITDANTIVTEPAPSALESVGVEVELTSFVSQNRDLPTYNVMQTVAPDRSLGGANLNYYTQYDGVINEYTMEIPETGMWSCTANFVFEQEYDDNPVMIAGQTTAAPPADRAVTSSRNATPGIRAFYVDNSLQNCKIKSLSLSVANNYEEDPFAACLTSYFRGDFAVSGSFIAKSLISNPFVWRDKSWNSARFSFAFRIAHGNDEETYIVVHRNVATEVQMPDGSGVVAHAEVSFAAEEEQTIQTTITVCKNW